MFTEILDAVLAEPSIAPFKASYDAFIASISTFLPYVLIALCLIVGIFGKRLFGIIRVSLMFAVGFIASVYWCAPIVTKFVPSIPGYAVGIAFGILLAVLSRMIYDIVFAGVIGFDVYNICYNALFLVEITSLTKNNGVASLIIAIALIIVALVLRKYMEMLVTSGIGGIGLAYAVKGIYDYTALLPLDSDTSAIFAGVVVAVVMFVIQFKNRIRY